MKQDLEQVTDWSFYDRLQEFTIREAACLWFELVPSSYNLSSDSSCIERRLIIKFFGVPDSELDSSSPFSITTLEYYSRCSQRYVSREQLVNFAQELELYPKFLFPGKRRQTAASVPRLNSVKKLDPRKRNSYLKVIKGLLSQLRIEPEVRGSAPQIRKIVEMIGIKIDEQTIRTILEELKDIDED